VQVHHDEGVANRIDPESCADAREGIGEALTGCCTGLARALQETEEFCAAGRPAAAIPARGGNRYSAPS
jgi:hypothetical protein